MRPGASAMGSAVARLQADRDMKASRDDPERVLEVLLAALAQEARSGTR